jgi:CHAT domain-containing protein
MHFAQLESAIVRCLVKNATPIEGEDASIEAVTNALGKSHTAFHFTGHGTYNFFRPENSAIALTDGLLTVKNISQLKLSSYRLVYLAACETALTGKNSVTNSEYVGLASAFLQAGAANVLSTLWPVNEISSAWLTIKFYQCLLAGDSPAAALHHAQSWIQNITVHDLITWIDQLETLPNLGFHRKKELKQAKRELQDIMDAGKGGEKPYSHPYHWAAYTLTGIDS